MRQLRQASTTVSCEAMNSKRSQRHTNYNTTKCNIRGGHFGSRNCELSKPQIPEFGPPPTLNSTGVCVVWSLLCLSSLSRPLQQMNGLYPLGTLLVLRRHRSRSRSRLDLAGCSCLRMLPEMVLSRELSFLKPGWASYTSILCTCALY